MRRKVRSNWSRKASPRPGCRSSYHNAAPSSSSSASGWLTTRMELFADSLHDLAHRVASDLALLDFTGTPIYNVLPQGFRVGIHDVVEAGDELARQERTILFR